MTEYANYIITAIGLFGFYLAGKKVWWAWYVNIANQVLWFSYGWATEQWGFVVGTLFYSAVFIKNAYDWTFEHRYKDLIEAAEEEPWSMGNTVLVDEVHHEYPRWSNADPNSVLITARVVVPPDVDRDVLHGLAWHISKPSDEWMAEYDLRRQGGFR